MTAIIFCFRVPHPWIFTVFCPIGRGQKDVEIVGTEALTTAGYVPFAWEAAMIHRSSGEMAGMGGLGVVRS